MALKTKMMRVSENEQKLIRLFRSSDKEFLLEFALQAFSKSDTFQSELGRTVESGHYDLISFLASRADIWRQFGIAFDELSKN